MRSFINESPETSKLVPTYRIAWRVIRPILPWLVFFLFILWGWRLENLFTSIPAFGDNLESLWTIDWWYQSLIVEGHSPAHTQAIFHPEGWQTSSQSYSPVLLLSTIPLTFLGGAAFAYNAVVLLLLALSFAGVYRLARTLSASMWIAILAGLLSTFWGFLWLRLAGHWQILWGVAFLPWMAWSLELSLKSPEKSKRWLLLTGFLWALSIGGSLYFIFLGGLVVVGWIIGQLLGHRINIRQAISSVLLALVTAGLLSLPFFYWFWIGIRKYNSPLPDIVFLDSFGASLNSLPIPALGHPWLGSISRVLYTGPRDESGVANLGLVTFVFVLASLALAWKVKRWRPLVVLFLVGLILATGPTVKWNGESVNSSLFRPINVAIWRLGHQLKPEVFPSEQPPPEFEEAIPMPGYLLAAAVPYWEGARTTSRYMLVAGVGFFLLAALAIKRLRPLWLQLLVAAILIVEVVPRPIRGVAYPPVSHPAFESLSGQSLGEDGSIDLRALDNERLYLPISGETVFATGYHDHSTAAGAGSVFPAHAIFLRNWLFSHAQPLNNDEFIDLLRGYDVRFLLIHMTGDYERQHLENARKNPELNYVDCFSAPAGRTPWSYPICVLEVRSNSPETINVRLERGWSDTEDWGVWAEGDESLIRWIATSEQDHSLNIEAFPHCLENERQTLTLSIQEEELAHHEWQSCENRLETIVIPQAFVDIGWNSLSFDYGYSARPIDVTGGENPDPRPLSLGFTRIEIAP